MSNPALIVGKSQSKPRLEYLLLTEESLSRIRPPVITASDHLRPWLAGPMSSRYLQWREP
jgi:hypothetical protein